MEKLGQEPAFPAKSKKIVIGQMSYTYEDEEGKTQIGHTNEFSEMEQNGMSKRFYAALEYSKSIISGHAAANSNKYFDIEGIVNLSYQFADELLKQEFLNCKNGNN